MSASNVSFGFREKVRPSRDVRQAQTLPFVRSVCPFFDQLQSLGHTEIKETEAHSCLKEESYNSTLLTLIDQRLSLTCFPWRSEHLALFPSIFSHLPTVFKRDGLIFPEIQFLFFFFCPTDAIGLLPVDPLFALVLSVRPHIFLYSKADFKLHSGQA